MLLAALGGQAGIVMGQHLGSQGEFILTLEGSDLHYRGTVEVSWSEQGWDISSACTAEDGGSMEWVVGGGIRLDETVLSMRCAFASAPPTFSFAQGELDIPWNGLELATIARLEEGGFGFGIRAKGPPGSLFREAILRFNLKEYRDEVLNPTFAPGFSTARPSLSLPLLCCQKAIQADVRLSKDGFEEARLRLQPPVSLFPWLSLGTTVLFEVEGKEISLSPSLSLESPQGVDLYWGIDWDNATNTLNGLRLYGFGFHAKIAGIEIHSLTSLAPDEIALVKPPYWELVGVVGKISTCCGEGEVSAAVYFGDSGLFGIAELDLEATLPLGEGATVFFSVSSPIADSPTFELRWEAEL